MRQPPFTPKSLAERWQVSAESIRQKCESGEIAHFRHGRLYRIPARIVEDIEECQTSASVGSEAGSVFNGMKTESDDAISLKHLPARKQKARQ